jgi:hypothetical protein
MQVPGSLLSQVLENLLIPSAFSKFRGILCHQVTFRLREGMGRRWIDVCRRSESRQGTVPEDLSQFGVNPLQKVDDYDPRAHKRF